MQIEIPKNLPSSKRRQVSNTSVYCVYGFKPLDAMEIDLCTHNLVLPLHLEFGLILDS